MALKVFNLLGANVFCIGFVVPALSENGTISSGQGDEALGQLHDFLGERSGWGERL